MTTVICLKSFPQLHPFSGSFSLEYAIVWAVRFLQNKIKAVDSDSGEKGVWYGNNKVVLNSVALFERVLAVARSESRNPLQDYGYKVQNTLSTVQ